MFRALAIVAKSNAAKTVPTRLPCPPERLVRSYADQAKHRYGSTIDIDAGNSRRCPVSSDCASVAPEGGMLKQDTKNDEHDHHYNERYGQPQNLAVVQQSKLTMPSDHHRLSLGNKQRNTAHDAHHPKRHDKSRKPEFADQHSIH